MTGSIDHAASPFHPLSRCLPPQGPHRSIITQIQCRAARERHRPKAFAMTTALDQPTGYLNFSRPSGKPVGRHRIIIREADDRHGRFEVLLPDGSTLPASRTPLLSAARYLLGEGADPSAVVEMRHASRPDTVAAFGRVGALAKLDVREDQTSGPRFCKWRPPPQDRA